MPGVGATARLEETSVMINPGAVLRTDGVEARTEVGRPASRDFRIPGELRRAESVGVARRVRLAGIF